MDSRNFTPFYLAKMQQDFDSRNKGFTPPAEKDQGRAENVRDAIAAQIAYLLDNSAEILPLDTLEEVDDDVIQDIIIETINKQQDRQTYKKDSFFQWVAEAKSELQNIIEHLLKHNDELSPSINALAQALKDPTDSNIQYLKQNIAALLTSDNMHGKKNYPALINCVCCLLNGEQRSGNDPAGWEDNVLKDFILQARVRLVNCPLIPYRFQWVSGGKSISGDPTVYTDIEKPWALYKRANDSGMLITAQSGHILGKIEKNMHNQEKAELQTVFNYDSADNHSIIIDFYSHEEEENYI